MNKTEFLTALNDRLQGLPQSEIDRSMMFYAEMIEDRKDEGMSEEEAVAGLGNMDAIVDQIMLDRPLPTLMKEKMRPKRQLKAVEIVLIILGFPIWFSLLVAFFSIIISVYVTIWSVIISLYATVLGFTVGGLIGVVASVPAFAISPMLGIFSLGASIVCIGLGILMVFPVFMLTKGLIALTGRFLKWIKSLFVRRSESHE